MIWVWLPLICQVAWIPPGLGVFHTLSASRFDKNLPGAYFGYSITYMPSFKRLIVSAPLADDIGQIFSCDIETKNCAEVPRNIEVKIKRAEYDHNYWYGATVKAGPHSFVTCAPLYAASKTFGYYDNVTRVGTFSRCYRYTDPTHLPSLLPNRPNDRAINNINLIELLMDTLGWSIDVANDDHLFIGGPAMNTGRVVRYSNVKKAPELLGGPYSEDIRDNRYNFGYSVVTGRFDPNFRLRYSKTPSLVYAVGSPYGKFGEGKIFFYTLRANNMDYRGDLVGSDKFVVGSLFGAVLCAARLTAGSDATALLVGAPTYSARDRDTHDTGAVFIYEAGKLPLHKLVRKIVGLKSGSHFGTAISSIGDMNGDGMDEIVIAAPYEDDGSGAVYIYSSSDLVSDKLQISAMQRIAAASGQRTFGLSLTELKDYDENGCNELAIGAPETNSVMLLRCIAFVKVNLYETIEDLQLHKDKVNPNRNATHFKFKSCLNVEYPAKPKDISAHVRIKLDINHLNAKLANLADKEYDIHILNRVQPECRTIVVETPENGKYNFPIIYTITATQLDSPVNMKDFVPSRVALSELSVLTSQKSLWISECSTADNCLPDLKLIDTTISEETPYVIGSSKTLKFGISILNKGEVAYNPCLSIYISGSTVEKPPPDCERVSSTKLKCTPKTTLRNNKTWVTEGIFLEVISLTSAHKNITIQIDMFNHCESELFERHIKVIDLKADPHGVYIKGVTDDLDDTVNITQLEASEGKTFEQIYTINNRGPTDWVGATAKLVLQERSFIDVLDVAVYTDDNNKGQMCEKIENATYICKIDKLFKKQITRLVVPMLLQPGTLGTAIEAKQNTIVSHLKIDLDGVIKEYEINTILLLKDASVPLWIWLVAAIMGLIILIIFVFILRECGFFRRKNKAELKAVRRSVKRQTIMRRSMVEGVRLPPGPDRQSLIAEQATPAPDRRVHVAVNDAPHATPT